MKIPLIKPYIDDNVKRKVLDVLDSGYLTEGSITKEFENVFSEYIGCKHSIAVTSCTTGLEVALRALGIGKGDEVIVPDYTYPATASIASIVGATAVIVDVNPKSMLIDYDEIEKAITKKTKAIIPVSLFGNPLNYGRLNEIKNRNDLYIIEDAACSVGAEYNGQKIGSLADISVFSFHPRKFITTGEGGMITTDNDEWANWMHSYKHFGMGKAAERQEVKFEIIGTNYKLSNILSAIGLEQMKIIDVLLEKRRDLVKNYEILLKGCDYQEKESFSNPSYQSFCIFIENRDRIMKKMREEGIEVQIGTYSLHKHKAFKNKKKIKISGIYKGSNYAYNHCLTLPLYHELTENEQKIIVQKLLTMV